MSKLWTTTTALGAAMLLAGCGRGESGDAGQPALGAAGIDTTHPILTSDSGGAGPAPTTPSVPGSDTPAPSGGAGTSDTAARGGGGAGVSDTAIIGRSGAGVSDTGRRIRGRRGASVRDTVAQVPRPRQ